jgi:PAS domain S-box-containing protein
VVIVVTVMNDEEHELSACRSRIEALERENAECRALLDIAFRRNPTPMWIYDPATLRFLDLNEATLEHFGRPREELLAGTLADVRPPEEVPRLLARAAEAIPAWGRLNGPWYHRRKDGTLLVTETASHPVEFQGHPARFVIVHDVTERQRIREALSLSRHQMQTVLDSAPDLIARFDAGQRFTYANAAWGSLLGIAPASMTGHRPSQLPLPAAFAESLENRVANELAHRSMQRFESAVPTPAHGEVMLDTRCVTVTGVDGQIDHVLTFSRDTTHKRRLEEALRESEERYRLAMEFGQVGRWECDIETNLVLWCDGCRRILGLPETTEDIPVTRFLDMVHPADRPAIEPVREAWRRGDPGALECRIIRPDGSVRWIYERGMLETQTDGRPKRLLGIIQDITDRKHAEIGLRESEERFRTLVELSSDYYWETDADLRFTAQSSAGADSAQSRSDAHSAQSRSGAHTAQSRSSANNAPLVPNLVGRPLWGPPEYHAADDAWRTYSERLARRSAFRDFLFEWQLPDGARRRLLASGTPVVDPTGEFRGYRGVSRDITDVENARIEVRDSEARFQRLAGSVREILWFADVPPFRIRFVNAAFEQITGIPGERLYTEPEVWLACVHPDDQAALVAARNWWVGRDVGYVFETEYRIVRPDGEHRWLRARRVVSSKSADGRAELSGISEDITEQKRAEAALRRSEELFRRLAENVPEVFWVGSPDFSQVIYLSPAFETVAGIRREEVSGQPLGWLRLVDRRDHPAVVRFLTEQRAGQPAHTEIRLVRPDGTERWVWVESFPFISSEGTTLVTGIAKDITERRLEQDRKLNEAVNQRDALVREVHHRIKNHLQGVVGLLRRHVASTPPHAHVLDAAIAQVQSMAIVHGLQGKGALGSIALNDMVPAIARHVGSLTGVTLDLEAPPAGAAPVRVTEGEAVGVALILNELMLNAAKHGTKVGNAGWMRVSMHAEGSGATVCMVNPGQLPPDFDFPRRGLGTGLGLMRALAPTRGFGVAFQQETDTVSVVVTLEPPVLAIAADIAAAA